MNDSVVKISSPASGVACIQMQDEQSKNTFSEALVRDLLDAFETISKDTTIKAVILTGYDNYFASGGTKEALLGLQEGKGTFADINIYSLALDCPVPVISAMQGHGIGGGFVMGLFADQVVLGLECVYTTNFMKYGFTPGMGATLVLPYKLGLPLAEEMLLVADTFRGETLKERGIPFPVVPKNEVFDKALEMAILLAEKPRLSLVTLKEHLTKSLREQLSNFIEKEVKMHEVTFHQSEVTQMIESKFIEPK
tara:strand:+ start:61732 stop:62487 length:756 start_codon:yes stop_codon:yes gene_type:complete